MHVFAAVAWSVVASGLEIATVDAPQRSPVGDSKVTVVRIDPAHY